MRMTTEEAFVKVLQRHGIAHAFGIIGSAFMPVSDLFGRAGVIFWDAAHEGAGVLMCDGHTRSTGAMGMVIAQNGPGATNFVTRVKTAIRRCWSSRRRPPRSSRSTSTPTASA